MEDDIYENETRYHAFMERIQDKTLPPDKRPYSERRAVYWIKNPVNLEYFLQLDKHFQAKDLSPIRRVRQLQDLLIITHATEKKLADCTREDIDSIMAFVHTRRMTISSKKEFIKNIKCMWKLLFPARDEMGRIDETAFPYPVRHLSRKIDKSKERMRNEKLTWEEFQQIIQYFSKDLRMQAFITLATDSIARPQEILSRKLKHIEWSEKYAVINLTEHGKEGCKIIQAIDSFPYIVKWREAHPKKGNPDAYLFINVGRRNQGEQLKPRTVNKHLKKACQSLGIKKNITMYSLKRLGVTWSVLRGDDEVSIQHRAGWNSTRSLKTYDLSDQHDSLRRELLKRGLIDPKNNDDVGEMQARKCIYCGHMNCFTDDFCGKCSSPLGRKNIKDNIQSMEALRKEVEELKTAGRIHAIGTERAYKEGKEPNEEYFRNLILQMHARGELKIT